MKNMPTDSQQHLIHIPTYLLCQGVGLHRPTVLGPKPQWKNFTVTVLEAHYSDNNFPEPMDIGFIARRLEVDPLHIHMWFKVCWRNGRKRECWEEDGNERDDVGGVRGKREGVKRR